MDMSLIKKLRLSLSIITGKLVRFGLKTTGRSATALPGNIALSNRTRSSENRE